MIFKVEVNNTHLPRIAKALGYSGPPIIQDPAAFKAFVEGWVVSNFREFVRAAIVQEKFEQTVQTELPDSDIAPAP